jgi:hypothetical protein
MVCTVVMIATCQAAACCVGYEHMALPELPLSVFTSAPPALIEKPSIASAPYLCCPCIIMEQSFTMALPEFSPLPITGLSCVCIEKDRLPEFCTPAAPLSGDGDPILLSYIDIIRSCIILLLSAITLPSRIAPRPSSPSAHPSCITTTGKAPCNTIPDTHMSVFVDGPSSGDSSPSSTTRENSGSGAADVLHSECAPVRRGVTFTNTIPAWWIEMVDDRPEYRVRTYAEVASGRLATHVRVTAVNPITGARIATARPRTWADAVKAVPATLVVA